MDGKLRTPQEAAALREALSQWQLAARTEVKRASSLPSSIFGSCDPRLEAELAESVEALMSCLHEPKASEIDESNAPDHIEMRVERIEASELQQLPHWMSTEIKELDLDRGLSAEYLGLLIDSCATGDEPTQDAARALLGRDFGVESQDELEDTTAALLDCLQDLIGQTPSAEIGDDQLAQLCNAIAASAILEKSDGQGAS